MLSFVNNYNNVSLF